MDITGYRAGAVKFVIALDADMFLVHGFILTGLCCFAEFRHRDNLSVIALICRFHGVTPYLAVVSLGGVGFPSRLLDVFFIRQGIRFKTVTVYMLDF